MTGNSQDEWRPIETAPMDREIILAGRWQSGRWDMRVGQWLVVQRWPFVGEGQPTHWRPLPSPPAEARSAPASPPADRYVPTIMEYPDSGRAEFLMADVATVCHYGEHYDTLTDMETGKVVGFSWPLPSPPAGKE